MGYEYQKRDHEVIDYQLYKLPDLYHPLRGPEPGSLDPGTYFSCLGAAQTFGCYCEQPYPRQLAHEMGLEVLNFGISGAGPSHFVQKPRILRYVNSGRLAIIQLMSGRSVSNHLFDSNGKEWLTRRSDGLKQGAEPMYRELLETRDYRGINRVLHETRQNWVNETISLLEAIQIPKILLWFSTRKPEYSAGFDHVSQFFGQFPQLVNREMVELVKPFASEYVESVSSDGLPQKLYSRFTRESVTVAKRQDLGGGQRKLNEYYPSPEMHQQAASLLEPGCRRLLSGY